MNWGKWIIVSFILFAAFIGTLVTVCVRQDISLVSKDYYKEELQYEKQLERLKNVDALEAKPVIRILEHGSIQIAFEGFRDMEKGELKLFRPSDADRDKIFSLTNATGTTLEFSTKDLNPGMYRAKLQWTAGGKEFYLEEVIFI